MKTKKLMLALTLSIISGLALAKEPTEAEMASAILKEINPYNMENHGCSRLQKSKNPHLSIHCRSSSVPRIPKKSIESFKKIGCAQAKVKGYYCKYNYSTSSNTGIKIEPRFDKRSKTYLSRFEKTRSGWVMTDRTVMYKD